MENHIKKWRNELSESECPKGCSDGRSCNGCQGSFPWSMSKNELLSCLLICFSFSVLGKGGLQPFQAEFQVAELILQHHLVLLRVALPLPGSSSGQRWTVLLIIWPKHTSAPSKFPHSYWRDGNPVFILSTLLHLLLPFPFARSVCCFCGIY